MMLIAHPEPAPNKCRDAQGSGVMSKPGKVKSNFQPKILRDLAWWTMWTCKENIGQVLVTKGLKAKNLPNPRLLQLLKAWRVVEREHLKESKANFCCSHFWENLAAQMFQQRWCLGPETQCPCLGTWAGWPHPRGSSSWKWDLLRHDRTIQ